MKKYWIDFSGYLCVEAENEDDAERFFWAKNWFARELGDPFSDEVWNIDGIEERPEGDPLAVVYGNNPPTAQEIEDFWNEK